MILALPSFIFCINIFVGYMVLQLIQGIVLIVLGISIVMIAQRLRRY